MRRLASLAFWGSLAALVYAQAGYPLLLAAIARVRGRRAADGGAGMRPEPGTPPSRSSRSSSPPTARRT